MKRLVKDGNPLKGTVKVDFWKAARNSICLILGLGGIAYFGDIKAAIAGGIVCYLTMYVGVVAYHRLLIHRSFTCPKWIEYFLVFIANFAGMGGPIKLIQIHDQRDWAQRKPACHPFFAHRENIFKDGFQQLFCTIELQDPPQFAIEISKNPFYKHLDKFWLLYQIPLALVLYYFGGWAWVCGGVFFKLFAVQFGHWLVAHFLHNHGHMPTFNKGAGVQGFNIPILALLTFGESYHNNHHLCPDVASNQFREGEIDMAWWLILVLSKLGLADKVKVFNQ